MYILCFLCHFFYLVHILINTYEYNSINTYIYLIFILIRAHIYLFIFNIMQTTIACEEFHLCVLYHCTSVVM